MAGDSGRQLCEDQPSKKSPGLNTVVPDDQERNIATEQRKDISAADANPCLNALDVVNQNQIKGIKEIPEIKLTCWQRFEEWTWYGMMKDFEIAASMVTMSDFQFKIIIIQRFIIFSILFGYMCYRKFFYKNFQYFTIWGYYLTTATLILGTWNSIKQRKLLKD